jgi:predicted N-acetyltransferase YhbS
MVCSIPYGKFGNIGDLIVIDEYRGQGLGASLMKHSMSYLFEKGAIDIFLDGVPAAVSLYERLGFRKICKSLRLAGKITGKISGYVRPLEPSDFDDVLEIDKLHFKADRAFFLKSCHKNNPKFSMVLDIDNNIAGYMLGSPRGDSIRIGPWVMVQHLDKTEEFLRAFVYLTGNQSLKLGVLETSVSSVELLKKLGFVQTFYSWRMARSDTEDINFSNRMYAIHSPARG